MGSLCVFVRDILGLLADPLLGRNQQSEVPQGHKSMFKI